MLSEAKNLSVKTVHLQGLRLAESQAIPELTADLNRIQVSCYRSIPLEFALNGSLQGLGRGGLAVRQIGLFWRSGQTLQPAHQFALSGVCGKLAHGDDLGFHQDVLTKET